jgi:hypothetical protein
MPAFALNPFVLNMINSLARFDIQGILVTVLVLTISLSFHEMAHAWAAYKLGDDTAALQGRLTMNPLAHLDPIGTLMFIFAGIGWAKPVPVNPARFTRNISIQRGTMLVSLAGPTGNLILDPACRNGPAGCRCRQQQRPQLAGEFVPLPVHGQYGPGRLQFAAYPAARWFENFRRPFAHQSVLQVLKHGADHRPFIPDAGHFWPRHHQLDPGGGPYPFDLVIWTPVHWLAQWLLQFMA